MHYVDTDSELLQLSLLCDRAEIYPDLGDELKKTSAIYKRSQKLSQILQQQGVESPLLVMDEDQQLLAGNAMMRQMAQLSDPDNQLEGFRKAANYLELGEYLKDIGLLKQGLNALNRSTAPSIEKPVIQLTKGKVHYVD